MKQYLWSRSWIDETILVN